MENETLLTRATRRVGGVARQLVGKSGRLFLPRREYVIYKGSLLPLPGLRFNGPDQQDDEVLFRSAIAEAERVTHRLAYEPDQVLVDIGCGQGRLAIGLVRVFGRAQYLGIDVSADSIAWCAKHIGKSHPTYRFTYLDLVNARYNPAAPPLSKRFSLPVRDREADVVYMWGVVTNMEPEHLPVYAREIARMLRPGGKMFLTANVEEAVPEVSINPPNYTAFKCSGPLHIVRYELGYFVDVFARAGLKLEEFVHHAAGNCQSDLYFIRE